MTEDTRVYEIRTAEGPIRMTIPETWKVTYGPVAQGQKYGSGGNALRVYESDAKQRAIFLDVYSFRDMSIPVQRQLIREQGKESWEIDGSGGRSRKSSTKVERRWVDENEIEDLSAPEGAPF